MEKFAIKIEGLTKAYKLYNRNRDRLKEAIFPKKKYHTNFLAIDGVDITIKKGDCVGIIGKNGSGKSTLLKLLTGVLTPSSGNIIVNGKIAALLELGAGFNMEYTGIENIYLNGTMMGYSKKEMEQKISDIINFADISDFIHQPVKTYSSGMFVRLAFAVAINVEPDILIVDEALSVGDIFFQLKCYKKFEDFKKQGKTVVLVTHDYGSVIKYCDYAIVLDKGKIAAQGNCREMIDVYKKILANQDKKSMINKIQSSEILKKDTIKEKMILNPNYTEYGSKDAEIIDYGVIDYKNEIAQTLLKNEEFIIRMIVQFNKNIKSPIFAFTIKDLKGNELSGTNTMLEGIELDEVKSGTILEINFKQLNPFQNGTLFLSYGCTAYNQNGNLEVFHRLFDIIRIDTVAEKNSVGFFDLNSEITISQL